MLTWCLGVLVVAIPLHGQTAQATLAGEVRNAQGELLAGVRIYAEHGETAVTTTATTNAQGQYVMPFLARGRYTVRVQMPGYRPLERRDVELHVAQRAVADFQLEALTPDLEKTLPSLDAGALTRGGIALVFGPDAQAKLGVMDDRPPPMTDATSTTVSAVIDEQRVREMPLAGRDIYTLFVLLPGVTSDNATQRGLGFSVNGFPVSSSNYLLDGVDNNNVLTTYPVTLLSPDAIHEYRLATANFSAEYGRGAFVANVITREGGNQWRGSLFEFLFNEKLNAGAFQDNASGRPRAPFKEHQFGYTLGGPVRRDRVFLFTSVEALRASTIAPAQTVLVPRPGFAAGGATARRLLEAHPVLPLSGARDFDANRVLGTIFPHVPVNTLAASGRGDFDLRPDRDRLLVRFGAFDQTFDNVTFSPYRGLGIPLVTASRNLAVGHIRRFNAALVNEAKIGINRNSSDFAVRENNLPGLLARDGTRLPGDPSPSTPQFYRDTVLHVVENLSRLLARHHLVAGGEYRRTWSASFLGPYANGLFSFPDLAGFAADRPVELLTNVDRFVRDRYQAPDYAREPRQNEFALFVQDHWRLTPRLSLNLGVRYEYFGVPHNARPSGDINFFFGNGATTLERLRAGELRRTAEIYRKDRNNVAPRLGLAFDLFGNSRTILRAGYGVYFDRVFNLVWDPLRQNAFTQASFTEGFRYAAPASAALPSGPAVIPTDRAFAVANSLRTPYLQTWFAGVQQALGRNALLEVSHTGLLGRKQVVADVINRTSTNSSVLNVQSLTNQGSSSYVSLQTGFQRRFTRGLQVQVSHTWAHAIDNQGDPLVSAASGQRAFQRQFDSRADYGNAEFDQRQNLIINLVWQTTRVQRRGWINAALSQWQVALISGYRTGFPLTAYSGFDSFLPSEGLLWRPRADYLGSDWALSPRRPATGGMFILDVTKFAPPMFDRLGNSGRNNLRGPGFWNYDLSLSREFSLARLREGARLQLRADFFNLFNHANLGNPNTFLGGGFGFAQFGRRGFQSLVLGTSPLNDFPRRVQVALKLSF